MKRELLLTTAFGIALGKPILGAYALTGYPMVRIQHSSKKRNISNLIVTEREELR